MIELYNKIAININPNIYKKDPMSSKLGEQIVKEGVELIFESGFDDFTFKKLALRIESTEASVYRYFENKHNLLVYLTMWYWGWQEYKLVMSTINIEDPKIRLQNAIRTLTQKVEKDIDFNAIDEVKLYAVVIGESSKAYQSKLVDKDNTEGFFLTFKEVVQRVADIILEINPSYAYPHMLVSSMIVSSQHQRYFADHLPRLTDCIEGEDSVVRFFTQLIFNELNLKLK